MKSQNEVFSVDAIAGDGCNYYNLWQTLSFFYPSTTAYTNTVQANRTTLSDADPQCPATANFYLSVTVDCDSMPGKKYVFSNMGGPVFSSTDTSHDNPLNKSRVGTLGSGEENEITDIHDYDYVVYKHNLYISGRELAHLFNLTGFDSKCDLVNPITRYILTQRYWDAVARYGKISGIHIPAITEHTGGNVKTFEYRGRCNLKKSNRPGYFIWTQTIWGITHC